MAINTDASPGSTAAKPRLMTIYAHPDDETFSMAGVLYRATAQGFPVAVVCATRGEAGEIADPVLATPATLGAVREQELRQAMAAVGVDAVYFLDYLDGHLPEANTNEATERITRHIRRFRPDVVVTFAQNGGYGHVDHMAIHTLTLAALQAAADPTRYPAQLAEGLQLHRVSKVYYFSFPRARMLAMVAEAKKDGRDFVPGGNASTIPVEEMGTPDDEITTRVTLTDEEFAAKWRAVLEHKTQLPADSLWLSQPADQLRAFVGTETFQLAPPPVSATSFPAPERDLFTGL